MDKLFGLDTPIQEDNLLLIRSFFDTVSASIAEEALRDAEIPFLKKERGSGTAVRIITGMQMFGSDFFVRPEDGERAEALMQLLFTPTGEEAEDEQA